MAARVTTVVVDCEDAEALAAFWCAVLGYEVVERSDEGWVEIGPPGRPAKGPVPTLLFQAVPGLTPGKNRLHLDLNATDREQEAELERLLGLGATPADVGQTGEESWRVLADPEGNVFCLLQSTVEPLG
jgi:catechol 2,3-dioxygenase-like lactoylglutathione lyase family enzyme